MQDDISASQPQYALDAYARDMHQYTFELWFELSKKLESEGLPTGPRSSSASTPSSSTASSRSSSADAGTKLAMPHAAPPAASVAADSDAAAAVGDGEAAFREEQ